LVYHWYGTEIEVKIDLHIHTKTGSDGNLSIEQVFQEAKRRNISFISITDHDSVACQKEAVALAREHGISYITGVELNVTFHYPEDDKDVSLDFLGYGYDIGNQELDSKLQLIKKYRETRAHQVLRNLNMEFDREGMARFTEADIKRIEDSVDGVFGRPHIANYLVEKGIVKDKQEAFDRYLVTCNVPKYPLSLAEASQLIRNAGGILVHAHPGDRKGTSLVSITRDLEKQTKIIEKYMLQYTDGVECWHTGHDEKVTAHYIKFARKHNMFMTGGSDCHQKPLLIGTLDIPDWVAGQFRFMLFSRSKKDEEL
jgi:predicted metal-dependent phosphoesterase TrpH